MRARTILIVWFFAAAAAGCSGVRTIDSGTIRTVSLSELPQVAAEVEGSATKGPGPMIVHVKAGERIPLRLELEAPFAALEAGENAIVLRRDVYLYVAPDDVMLGFDGARFARMGDWKTLKKLAGVGKGQLAIGFGAGKSDPPRIDVRLGMK